MQMADLTNFFYALTTKANPILINVLVAITWLALLAVAGNCLRIFYKKVNRSELFEKRYEESIQRHEERYFKDTQKYVETQKELQEKNNSLYKDLIALREEKESSQSLRKRLSESLLNLSTSCKSTNDLVNKFDRGLATLKDVDKLIGDIIHYCAYSLQYSEARIPKCILWKPDETKQLLLKHHTNIPNSYNEKTLFVNKSFAGHIFFTGEEKTCPNIEKERYFQKRDTQRVPFISLAGVPINFGGEVVGVLTIDSDKENAFTEDGLKILYIFGHCISTCLYLKKQLELKSKKESES